MREQEEAGRAFGHGGGPDIWERGGARKEGRREESKTTAVF